MILRRPVSIAILAFLVLLVLVAFSYSRVQVSVSSVESVRPAFKTDTSSLISGALGALKGDPGEALTSVINGLDVKAELQIENGGILPVYFPELRHVVFVGDPHEVPSDRVQKNPGLWLMPQQQKTVAVTALVPLEEIPELALSPIINGGDIELAIESELEVVGFATSHTTRTNVSVIETVREWLDR